jgi:hypothetical protein
MQQHNPVMKNSSKSSSLILAAGLAGVAIFSLANSSFIAALPGDAIMAFAISAAVIGVAIFDYSRRIQSVTVPCRVMRPVLPANTPSSSGCGSRSNHTDRRAA